MLTGARSPGVGKVNTTQAVDYICVFFKLGHSAIGGQMYPIGLTELVHVNIELYFEPVSPFHSFHGYSDCMSVENNF